MQKVREPAPFDAPDLIELERRGARIVRATTEARRDRSARARSGTCSIAARTAPRSATASATLALPGLRGASAQGSETGFGVPFVGGVNPGAVIGARLVQIASCNTHATATLLTALGGPGLARLDEADLVCVRRCEDLGGRERLVGASVVSRHRDPVHGTHHAADAARVFATLGLAPIVTSSDVTTPSQLMHAVRFDVRLREPRAATAIAADLAAHPRLATTAKFDSNRVFELGRRYGFQGRLFAHAIVVANDLMISGPQREGAGRSSPRRATPCSRRWRRSCCRPDRPTPRRSPVASPRISSRAGSRLPPAPAAPPDAAGTPAAHPCYRARMHGRPRRVLAFVARTYH